jgi:site-specific DNA-methyltransferase (cytosine-N4-specific)
MNLMSHMRPRPYHETRLGRLIHGDSLAYMRLLPAESVNLVMTSPPFGLVREKDYGNVSADYYLEWFAPFAEQFKRILKPNGSLVIDIGGAWEKGQPTRSLYHFELAIMLRRKFGMHLAQEFYWWNPSKLPTPAEWVTVRRVRAKDAVNTVWWFSPTPWPKASNKRVLLPYSDSMETLLTDGYRPKKRPSGHDISNKFQKHNGGAITPNLIAIPNTESNSAYQRYCQENRITEHPARFPSALPEFFVRMLTDEGDLVVDPFAGSCVTGEVCERLGRTWTCIDLDELYLKGAMARFRERSNRSPATQNARYALPHPGTLWNGPDQEQLQLDGGLDHRSRTAAEKRPAGKTTGAGK